LTKTVFPFSAILGQGKVKIALLLNAVDPRLGGVLISGSKGSGKSTIVRSFGEILPNIEKVKGCPFNCNPNSISKLCPSCREQLARQGKLTTEQVQMRIVDLPLSATDDGLLGTLNVEEVMKKGIKTLRPGLLAEANQNILYIDEVNLLPDHLINYIIDPASSGWNIVQREGISLTHPSSFTLIATMNPEEGELRPQILDRFALSVKMEEIENPKERIEIVRRNLAFEEDPVAFGEIYHKDDQSLADRISKARETLQKVKISPEIVSAISKTAAELRVEGFRSDISIVKAARALAAFEGRETVEAEDVFKVSELALGHRSMGKNPDGERSVSDTFRNILYRELPEDSDEAAIRLVPAKGKDTIENHQIPKTGSFIRRKPKRQLPVLISNLLLIGLSVAFLLFLSMTILALRSIALGLPLGSMSETATFNEVLLTMGLLGIAASVVFIFMPKNRPNPRVFFYESLGRGFQRRLVHAQRGREYPETKDSEEEKDKEARASRFSRIINVPLYSSIGRIYKLVLNRGPKLSEESSKEHDKRYKFSLERRKERKTRSEVEKHGKIKSISDNGRYVSYEYPRAKPWDIAFGPTLRAAAMHQNLKSPGLKIETNDIRIKVRESKAPLTIVILLDMSESMSMSLPNIRNAILSMHDIAYKKHDRIGLVVFKGSGATILQPPTTNLDLVVAKLRDVGASDLTPLASGMFQSWQLLRNERMRNRNTVPVLAIISDGIANVTLSSPLSPLTRSKFMNYAQADAIDAAFLLQREGIHVLVINPSHSPGGELRDSLAHAELAGTIDRIWLEPTELLMRILAITGGSYYGIGEGGTLEDINLTKVFGGFSR
jgi:Mg-chelatase subunit ChlI/Mg-chelatase subunit ChlD